MSPTTGTSRASVAFAAFLSELKDEDGKPAFPVTARKPHATRRTDPVLA